MGETLFAGSATVEAVGLHIGIDMTAWWSADEAFLAGLRDKEVLAALVAEVGGAEVAAANTKEKGATLKAIVRDHLDGINGRTKVDGWVPKWAAARAAAHSIRQNNRAPRALGRAARYPIGQIVMAGRQDSR